MMCGIVTALGSCEIEGASRGIAEHGPPTVASSRTGQYPPANAGHFVRQAAWKIRCDYERHARLTMGAAVVVNHCRRTNPNPDPS